jgi:tetratricopeptide (TPR) repeat protein
VYKAVGLAIALACLGAQTALAVAPADRPSSNAASAAARCFGKESASWRQLRDACASVLAAKDLQPAAKAVAFYNRGIAYQRLGAEFAVKAIADFTSALKLKPDFAHALAARGSMLVAKGKFDKGIADLSKAVELAPTMAIAFNNRAVAYFGKQDFATAIADFTKAIELDPANADSYAARGSAYMSIREDVQAMSDLNRAIAMNARHPIALYNRGLLYAWSGQSDKARADFKAVLTVVPDHPSAKRDLGRLSNGQLVRF